MTIQIIKFLMIFLLHIIAICNETCILAFLRVILQWCSNLHIRNALRHKGSLSLAVKRQCQNRLKLTLSGSSGAIVPFGLCISSRRTRRVRHNRQYYVCLASPHSGLETRKAVSRRQLGHLSFILSNACAKTRKQFISNAGEFKNGV